MIDELDLVVLKRDLPETRLAAGDVGTVVLVHRQGEGYEVELTTLSGDTVAFVTLDASDVRRVERDYSCASRELMAPSMPARRPSGKSITIIGSHRKMSSPFTKKYLSSVFQNIVIVSAQPDSPQGTLRPIVTNVRRVAMDAGGLN